MADAARVFDRSSVNRHASLQAAAGAEFGSVSRVLIIPYLAVVFVFALSQQPIAALLYLGLPAVMIASASISAIILLSQTGRLYIKDDSVALINSWSCYRSVDKRVWMKPLDFEDFGDAVKITLGHGSYRFHKKDWQAFDEIREALASAYRNASSRPLMN